MVQGYKGRYEQYCKQIKIQPDPTIDWAYIDPHVYYGEGAMPTGIGEMVFALKDANFYDAVRGVVGEVKDGI